MNDFSRSSDLLFSILFADDTSVFIEGTYFDAITQVLNLELENVNSWLKANKLTVNLKKTHYIMFHQKELKIIQTSKYAFAMKKLNVSTI